MWWLPAHAMNKVPLVHARIRGIRMLTALHSSSLPVSDGGDWFSSVDVGDPGIVQLQNWCQLLISWSPSAAATLEGSYAADHCHNPRLIACHRPLPEYRPAGDGQRTVTDEYTPAGDEQSTVMDVYRPAGDGQCTVMNEHRQSTKGLCPNTDLNSPDRNELHSILACLVHISPTFQFQNAHEKKSIARRPWHLLKIWDMHTKEFCADSIYSKTIYLKIKNNWNLFINRGLNIQKGI